MTRGIGMVVGAVALLSFTVSEAAAGGSTLVVRYSENGPGGISYSFHQSSNPTPISYGLGEYTEVSISDATGLFAGQNAVDWYSASFGGGYDLYGPQVYTGPESAPVFAPSVYYEYDPNDGFTGALTISAPEPSAWALMLLGFGAVGVGLRASRRRGTVGRSIARAL